MIITEEQRKLLEEMGYVIIDKNDPDLTPAERLGIWLYEQRRYEKELTPEQREIRKQHINERIKDFTEMGISIEEIKK